MMVCGSAAMFMLSCAVGLLLGSSAHRTTGAGVLETHRVQVGISTPSYGHSGQDAPLNEDGYLEVASLKSDIEMKIYVVRVLQAYGKKKVMNQGDLSGFVPYYSGTKATQSFEALRNELSSVSWASPADADANSDGQMMCKQAAQKQVMCEFPKAFTNGTWNPNAVCVDSTGGAHSAGDRAAWCTKNECHNICEEAAQAQVMCGHPRAFTNGEWNASAACGDHSAGERALWLMRGSGRVMGKQAAQAQVMCEFPENFSKNEWNPNAVCTDSTGQHTARDRADWLMKNKVQGMMMCERAAQEQVIWEHPDAFIDGKWDASVACGEHSAGDRAVWIMAHYGEQ